MNLELPDHLRVADHQKALRLGGERSRRADRGQYEQPGKRTREMDKMEPPTHGQGALIVNR